MISNKIADFNFPKIDRVIGIARGGVVPAALIAHQLNVPLGIIQIRYRDDDNVPIFQFPIVYSNLTDEKLDDKHILIVDDVSVSGKTLETARQLLGADRTFTFVLKGTADYVLLPEIKTCVRWPWNIEAEKNIPVNS